MKRYFEKRKRKSNLFDPFKFMQTLDSCSLICRTLERNLSSNNDLVYTTYLQRHLEAAMIILNKNECHLFVPIPKHLVFESKLPDPRYIPVKSLTSLNKAIKMVIRFNNLLEGKIS